MAECPNKDCEFGRGRCCCNCPMRGELRGRLSAMKDRIGYVCLYFTEEFSEGSPRRAVMIHPSGHGLCECHTYIEDK